jgi:hypothetical protein
MNDPAKNLDRLLRAAAQTPDDDIPSVPFGFDTRVVALWRSGNFPRNGVSGLLRRVILISTAIAVVSTVAAVRELQQTREVGESFTNDFAIADSAIQTEFSK